MRIGEVEKYLSKKIMDKFHEWINGQTVGRCEDGQTDYYDHDVRRFAKSVLTGEPTYFD